MIEKFEPYFLILLFIFVVFFQIDSHFLDSRFIGNEMGLVSTIIWIHVTIFIIFFIIRSFKKKDDN